MTAVYLSPVFGAGAQLLDNKGVILSGGFINTYLAGTTTPVATYVDNTGTTQNATSIPLDGYGRPPNEIWIAAGVPIKMIVTDANSVTVGNAYDNISGVGDSSSIVTPNTEWIASGLTPTFVDGTHFTLVGDQRAFFPVGQRIKAIVTAGTAYSTVAAVAYSTNTTITTSNDGTALDSGLSAVSYGLFNAAYPSISAIGVKYDVSIIVPGSPASIAQPVQRLDRAVSLFTTTGTAPAFVFTPTQPLGAYATNAPFLVKFHAASGTTPTLNVSGIGALNLKQINSAGTKVSASFAAGAISEVVYDGTDLVLLNLPVVAGTFLRRTAFLSSGTWTAGASTNQVNIICVGGGGGGGANGSDAGGGGGSGGASIKFTASAGSSQAVTVGAGGAGGTSAIGSTGGMSSFGSICSGLGGVGGGAAGRGGGVGGAASGGDFNMQGGPGGWGGNGTGGQIGGAGGNSYLGGGAQTAFVSAQSTGSAAAANSGGGGGGAVSVGGAGGSGIVVVEEYT
jgi:hypothetical protein